MDIYRFAQQSRIMNRKKKSELLKLSNEQKKSPRDHIRSKLLLISLLMVIVIVIVMSKGVVGYDCIHPNRLNLNRMNHTLLINLIAYCMVDYWIVVCC